MSDGTGPAEALLGLSGFRVLEVTVLTEWAYVRPYRCEAERARALARWMYRYNRHRVHAAIGGPPVSRVTNVPGDYTWHYAYQRSSSRSPWACLANVHPGMFPSTCL